MQTEPVGQARPEAPCRSHGWPAEAERACRQLPAPPLLACSFRVTKVLALQMERLVPTLLDWLGSKQDAARHNVHVTKGTLVCSFWVTKVLALQMVTTLLMGCDTVYMLVRHCYNISLALC